MRSIAEYHVGGIKTNLAFHRRVMRHPAFRAGDYDTGFIERHKADLLQPAPDEETAALAAIAAAAEAARAAGGTMPSDLDLTQTQPSSWRRRRDD